MAKLDEGVARVAVVIGGRDRAEMDRVAAEVAGTCRRRSWRRSRTAGIRRSAPNKAGSPDLSDSWPHLWFEALTELLYQRKADGLPLLLTLMDRDDSTYHQYVIVRLLRLAADGVEPEAILARIRTRLESLHYGKTRESVREVTYWKMTDPRPVELLRRMADVVCARSDGDTVGLYLRQMGEELPVHLARMKDQQG